MSTIHRPVIGHVLSIDTTVYASEGRITMQTFAADCRFSMHLDMTSKQAFELAELLKAAALMLGDQSKPNPPADRFLRESELPRTGHYDYQVSTGAA
jgi:hypothetical protein